MKNVHNILTSLQHKPQFKKILHYKCINKLLATILPAIQKSVKHGYLHKKIFYITITAALNKYDKDNIIKTIKTVLNSKMILESERFIECSELEIDDVVVYVAHKPTLQKSLYTTKADQLTYSERATGDLPIDVKDERLQALLQSIQDIIKKERQCNS